MTSRGPDAACDKLNAKYNTAKVQGEYVVLDGIIPVPTVPTPIIKMKRVPIKIDLRSKAGHWVFKNEAGREIVTLTVPSKTHHSYVDVTIGPDAKLDELATVMASLMGEVIYLS